MKILKVRLKNLNSLRGEWCIDFTRPEFLSVSIFAIDGPTGASKSTVIDAISLAFYGITPRGEQIETFDNPVISPRSEHCFAEVSFDSEAGSFKCCWSISRNENGLVETKHELFMNSTDEIIESNKNKIIRAIEEKTGLDFTGFKEKELKAQEGYASFSNDIPEKKTAKVAQLNVNEFSSSHHRRIYEDRVIEHEIYTAPAQTIEYEHNLWKDEQVALYQKNIIEKQESLETVYATLADYQKIQEQLIQNSKLQDEITELSLELVQIDRQLQNLTNERTRLERVQRAAKVEDSYSTLSLLRKQRQHLDLAIESETSKIPHLEAKIHSIDEQLKAVDETNNRITRESQALAPLFSKIRSLDQSAEEFKELIEHNHTKITGIKELLINKQQELENLLKAREAAEMTLRKVDDYLEQKSQDSSLTTQYPLIESWCVKMNNLESILVAKEEKINDTKDELELFSLKMTENKTSLATMQKKQIDVQIKIEQNNNELEKLLDGRLLREYRAEKDSLLRELCFLQKITRLEEERQIQHEDQTQISKSNPQPGSASAEIDLTEKKIMGVLAIINQADNFIEENDSLTAMDQDLSKKIEWLMHEQNVLLSKKTEMTNVLKDLEVQTSNMQAEFIQLSNNITRQLAVFGIFDFSNPSLALNNLAERLKFWQDMNQHKTSVQTQLAGLVTPIQSLEVLIKTQNDNLDLLESDHASNQKAYEAIIQEREALFGNKNPDLEEQRLEKAQADALQSDLSLKEELAFNTEQLEIIQSSVQDLREQCANTLTLLTKLESDFIQELSAAGFVSETDFSESLMPVEERFILEKQLGDLEVKKAECSQRLKDKKAMLVLGDENNSADWTLMKLELAIVALNKQARQLDQEIRELSDRLEDQRSNNEPFIEEQPIMV